MRLHKKLKQNQSLLPKNSSLLLAVSGGQDSMALLKLIIDLKKLYNWQIEVWHGDHQWHDNSEKIANELNLWCHDRKILFRTNKAEKIFVRSEERARDWRYKQLIIHAKSLSSNKNSPNKKILTGHTATDRAETMIMNLARGSDLIGMSTLRETRKLEDNLELVRPLLIFNRDETLKICKELNLPIWIDPSNSDLDLNRNKIRNQVLPILNSIHKGADSRIASVATRLESYCNDQEFFAKLAIEFCKEEQINSLSRKKITNFPSSIRKIVIFNWLKLIGIKNLNSLLIEEINIKISDQKPPGSIDLHGGFCISWQKETVYISNQNI